MSKSPAFQFYPADFMADGNQILMELDEVGAYIRLICVCWTEGHIPYDMRKLAKLARCTVAKMEKIWPALEECFEDDPAFRGYLVHPRLEKERNKQASFREKAKQAGKKSAAVRNERSTSVQGALAPSTNQNPTLLSSASAVSSSALPEQPVGSRQRKKRAIPTYSAEFEELWRMHARGPKADAARAYIEALDSGVAHGALVAGLRAYVREELRADFKGAHLFRWIRDRRWEAYATAVTPGPTRPMWVPQIVDRRIPERTPATHTDSAVRPGNLGASLNGILPDPPSGAVA